MACLPERCGAELDREPRLFMALPGSDTLCRPAKFCCRRLTSLPLSFPALLLLSSICCAGIYFFLPAAFFRHLVLGSLGGCAGGRCQRSPPKSARNRKQRRDNPRLKRTSAENCLFFKVCKYFSITCRHFLSP